MADSKFLRMANGKVLIPLFIVVFLFGWFTFAWRNETLKTLSGNFTLENGKPTLDSDCFYTAEKAYDLFNKLGDDGRLFYAWTEITLDLIFPVLYTLFLSLLLIFIFRKLSNFKFQRALVLLPLMAMLFDFCENALIAFLLFAYPKKYIWIAVVASLSTKLKWIFVFASLAAIFYGLIRLVIRYLGKGGKAN
jgi:hypothetical protein